MKTENHSIHDVLAKNATSFLFHHFKEYMHGENLKLKGFLMIFPELLNQK